MSIANLIESKRTGRLQDAADIEVLEAIQPQGRLYATLCEFHTQELLPDGEEASAIIGVVGSGQSFQLELRLNCAPLPEALMDGWVERLLGRPARYAPLPPFV